MSAIAIVGMGCRYAEARTPRELWENVLAQRRSFRRIPRTRLDLTEYSHPSQAEDRISVSMAAVLEDYEFDRVRFRVSAEAFQSADLVHWLALDVAAQALGDARLLDSDRAQRERTSVYVGNTLTGEFSRASVMRLRWPYVRRVIAKAMQNGGAELDEEQLRLIAEIESLYKSPFPATTEESLAGGLSNTIAGRICNFFDFKGGGYTVDGACASSLLAITTACSALEAGDVDVALAGGVDLSLDPFELAGFTKLGALAADKMRVFDEQSAGFWPGEGCGMVVLMRHEDAVAQQHPIYAVVRGWGISSDGNGGITRPELAGQLLALERAYRRAGYPIDSVSYFEGHGTGTSVGDATELQALSQARRAAQNSGPAAAIGSIKANIGHTKAAAGVAALIKAAMAVQANVIPPTTGCDRPHPELRTDKPALRVLHQGELWPAEGYARAGVSAFGFGGINSHVTLESADSTTRKGFTAFERQRLGAVQDCEVFLLQAASLPELAQQLDALIPFAGEISYSQMTDLAAHLAGSLNGDVTGVRAACIASSPEELIRGVKTLQEWCVAGVEQKIDCSQGVFLNTHPARPRIGFLFPGQASPVYTGGGAWARRFAAVREQYERAQLPHAHSVATDTAQPCIVTASLAGLLVLESLGLKASVAVGHSLGDITALFWAGACDEETLLRIVRERGRLMAELGAPSGSMASVYAASGDVRQRLNGDPLVVAAENSPQQTVISGEGFALRRFLARVNAEGLTTTLLPVSQAFHSPLMADAAAAFSHYLQSEAFQPLNLQKRVVSSVTAAVLPGDTGLRELLTEQITLPVQFARAAALAAEDADLLIEVGPGAVLTGIMEELADKPAVALDAGGASLRGLLTAAGAAFALGADIEGAALFGDRFHRPVDLRRRHKFLENPCETVNSPRLPAAAIRKDAPAQAAPAVVPDKHDDALEILRNLVAQRAELPLPAIQPEHRFLDDLHLNSITISQIILQAAAQAGAAAPVTPAEFTNATLAEAAALLEQNRGKAPAHAEERHPAGAEPWIRTLSVEWVEQPMRAGGKCGPGNWQVMAMDDGAFRRALEEQFKSVPGNGVVCCLPREKNYNTAQYILDSVKSALQKSTEHVVLVQRGELAGALARSLFLENSQMKVTAVDVPVRDAEAADLIAREALAATGFTEARYDADGVRREPRLTVLWPEDHASSTALTAADVTLVSGGGKGIAAECALALARSYKCSLALVGRSDPARDDELAANLARFRNAGVSFAYYAADLTKEEAAGDVVKRAQAELGTVTAVLHGAGINNPKRVEEITASDLQMTLAAKTGALSNLLRRIDPSQLRLLLTFGSIIGRTGLHGEGDYGLANEWLRTMVEEWQVEHPACRCMNLEWSVWAGTGMGQRLGVLDSLQRQGITPLPLDEALRMLPRLLEWKSAPTSFIVTGRTGSLPTLRFQHSEPPLLRFLENVRLHYPGVELIVEAGLNTDTDPYLSEHAFQGQQLVPAVMGMEAMAQAACALEQTDQRPSFRNLRFISPIVVPPGQTVVVRIAAVRRQPGVVAAVVRCSSTAFQVDHFRGECVFGRVLENDVPLPALERDGKPLAIDPARDLYGRILFHRGRFRRIKKYQHLEATCSLARLNSPAGQPWFARYFPSDLLLGDAASRDAALHSVQACIPHKTVLPTGVDSITVGPDWTYGPATVIAQERDRNGDDFVYDLRIEDAHGRLCERWEGLRLHAVAPIDAPTPWPAALLIPYFERKLAEIFPAGHMQVSFVRSGDDRGNGLMYRPDGKPESSADPKLHVSRSHAGKIILDVRSQEPVGCDMEAFAGRNQADWQGLLGPQSFSLAQSISKESKIPLDWSATQVWALKEALRKSGAALDEHLHFEKQFIDGWVVVSRGCVRAAMFHTFIQDSEAGLAFAFVSRRPQ